MEKIGEQIRKQRLSLALSQANFAELLKISAAAYCKIENGQTDLNISRLVQICKILKISPVQLFDSNKELSSNTGEVIELKKELLFKEEELNKLRKKVIQLYDKLGM